jgi:CheY-like chemotaxis protein
MEGSRAASNRHAGWRHEQPAKSAKCAPEPLRGLLAIAEPSSMRLCREVLEAAGFHVDSVDSGIGAVMAVREWLPQFILIDLQLRDVPGREAVGWLRSNPALRSIPIILLGSAEDERAPVAPQPGAILRKPLSPAAIERAVRAVLRPTP